MSDLHEISDVLDEITEKYSDLRKRRNKTVREILAYPEIREFVSENEENLSQEIIINSLSKLNEYKIEKESIKKGEPGQNPGFTPELFINGNYIAITYVPTEKYLEEKEEKERKALVDNRMMSLDVREASFEKFDRSSKVRLNLLGRVLNFIEDYKKDPTNAKGIYLSGNFGVGKTYLMGALANELSSIGVRVSLLHYPTLVSDLRATIKDNTTFQAIDEVRRVPVLILDDIGAENNTSWVRDDVLTLILEHRMKEHLPTFFTSNFTMSQLEEHLTSTKDGDSPTKAARIMERIKFLADEYELDGENRRHK